METDKKNKIMNKKVKDWYFSQRMGIEIIETSDFDAEIKQYGINWSARGTVSLEKAREFSNELNECMALVNTLNQFALHETTAKPKVVILDDNPLSMAKYAEEYPENFKEISDTNHENTNELPVTHCPLDADHELNAESEK